MTNTALPIRWACPRMPVPAPAAPLHTGQSDFHPARTPITKAYFSKEYLVNSTCIKKRLNKNVLSLFSYENPMKDFDYFLLSKFISAITAKSVSQLNLKKDEPEETGHLCLYLETGLDLAW